MHDSPLLRQIHSIPVLMETLRGETTVAVQEVAVYLRRHCIERLTITGCGDSYCAALAGTAWLQSLCGMEAQAVPMLDLARFYPAEQLRGSAVLIISYSGKVSRAVELARRVAHLGGHVIALCGNETSPLAQAANITLRLDVPSFEPAPGLRSYCACLLGLAALAQALMENGTRKAGVERTLAMLPEAIEKRLPDWEETSRATAQAWHPLTGYECVAAYADMATALFGVAKALEVTGKPALAQNMEDWLHMQFFIRDIDRTGLAVITHSGCPARSRTLELCEAAQAMGRPVLMIDDKVDFHQGFETPALAEPLLHPLVQYLPLAMHFAHGGLLLGEEDFRGGTGRFSACQGFATVAGSREIIIDTEGA